jgi:hypothetical protein
MIAAHPSDEPNAGKPNDGICGGESQQWFSYPTFVQNRTLPMYKIVRCRGECLTSTNKH